MAAPVVPSDSARREALCSLYDQIDGRAWREYQSADYGAAVADYRRALEIHQSLLPKDDSRLGRDYRLLANVLDQSGVPGSWNEADLQYRHSLVVFQAKAKNRSSIQYFYLLITYADHCGIAGQADQMEYWLSQALHAGPDSQYRSRAHEEAMLEAYDHLCKVGAATGDPQKVQRYKLERRCYEDYLKTHPRKPKPVPAPVLDVDEASEHATVAAALDNCKPFFIIAALMLPALLLYGMFTARKYIRLNSNGIEISHLSCFCQRDFVAWNNLKRVELAKQNQLTFSARSSGGMFRMSFVCQNGSRLEINWTDLVSCLDAGEFINFLKTWSPQAIKDCVFPTDKAWDKIDGNTYTHLWFKHYSIGSERQRNGLLQPGEKLCGGRYEVAGTLGGGGQGTAYLAVESPSAQASELAAGREVVLKEYILPVHRGEYVLQESGSKLHQEAQLLRRLDHPRIVKVFDEFIEDHRGYLVMEHVGGRALGDLVKQQGVLPESEVIDIALQTCDVLEYLHSMEPPLVHRDITPGNLIVQDDGQIKLIDFNVAHQLESNTTATVVGKQCFIPPEQFRGKPTVQSDIYALGCTLYVLLTGYEPEPLTVSHPRSTKPDVSIALDSIVARCTAQKSDDRFSAAADVRAALQGTGSRAISVKESCRAGD